MKSSTIPNSAGKKGQLTTDIKQIQDSVSSADFRAPDDKMDDQNLTEDQMAWRYASKQYHVLEIKTKKLSSRISFLDERNRSEHTCKLMTLTFLINKCCDCCSIKKVNSATIIVINCFATMLAKR